MSDTHYFKVYPAGDGWRWHEVKSSDITSESGEAYQHKQDAMYQALAHASGVEVRVENEEEADGEGS